MFQGALLLQLGRFRICHTRVRPDESSWHLRSFEDNCIRALKLGLGTFHLSFNLTKPGVKRLKWG